MGDENALPSSKKRAAGREISKDNPGLDDEEDVPEQETGTFQRASDDVLAGRRIVKVRRHQTSTPASAPTANPFSGIRLVPPPIVAAASPEATAETQVGGEKMAADEVDQKAKTNNGSKKETILNDNDSQKKTDEAAVQSDAKRNNADTAEKEAEANSADQKEAAEGAEKTDEANPADQNEGEGDKANIDDGKEENPAAEKTEVDNAQNEGKKDDNNPDAGGESAPFSSFQQLSSNQNAFTGLAGTGFANSTFSFGSLPKDGSPSGSGLGPFHWSKTDPSSIPSFSFGASNNGSAPLFGTIAPSIGTKGEGSGLPSMPEVTVETGEESEETVFLADSVLFEFLDGGWKERGKGEVKVNVSSTRKEKARLVMRARGNYRLILNAYIYPDMKLTNMDKRGITFACVNSTTEGKNSLSTFALKFKDGTVLGAFSAAVAANTGKATPALSTPGNSPKASDD